MENPKGTETLAILHVNMKIRIFLPRKSKTGRINIEEGFRGKPVMTSSRN